MFVSFVTKYRMNYTIQHLLIFVGTSMNAAGEGNVQRAKSTGETAKILSFVGIGCGIVFLVILITLYVLGYP